MPFISIYYNLLCIHFLILVCCAKNLSYELNCECIILYCTFMYNFVRYMYSRICCKHWDCNGGYPQYVVCMKINSYTWPLNSSLNITKGIDEVKPLWELNPLSTQCSIDTAGTSACTGACQYNTLLPYVICPSLL